MNAEEAHKKAWEFYLENRYSQAKRQLIENLRHYPDYAPSHLLLGQIYFFSNTPDYDAALKKFEKVTSISPTWQEGFQWLGSAFEKIGKFEDAIAAYHETIRLSPEDARPYVSLGNCFVRKGWYSEAIKMFRKGLELKPYCTEADVRLFLAEALVKNMQVAEARTEWQRVLEIKPGYPSDDAPHEEAKKMLAKYPLNS